LLYKVAKHLEFLILNIVSMCRQSVIVENIFFDRSDKINFCAEIMHRNFPPPNLCNLRPPLTTILGRGWLPIPGVEVSRERPPPGPKTDFVTPGFCQFCQ